MRKKGLASSVLQVQEIVCCLGRYVTLISSWEVLHAGMFSENGNVAFLHYFLLCWKRPYFPFPFCLLFI